MSHLTNAQIFKAIGLDDSVNPSSKYTLLICAHVLMDWKAWSGHISADQLAAATNQSSRGVQRHLKTLVEAGWLFRHAEVRGPGLHHKASFTAEQQVCEAAQRVVACNRSGGFQHRGSGGCGVGWKVR